MDIRELEEFHTNVDEGSRMPQEETLVVSEPKVLELVEKSPGVEFGPITKEEIASVAREVVPDLAKERRAEIIGWIKRNNYGLKNLEGIKEEDINAIFSKLMAGKSETEAIKGKCSWALWCKFKEEDPDVKQIVESALQYRKSKLADEMYSIADQEERTRVGEVARDKLMIDVREREMARLEGKREKLEKDSSGNAIVPIQFNLNLK